MKRLFNDGWEFCKQPLETSLEQVQKKMQDFYAVGIPHDWMISQVENLYEDGMGWYHKKSTGQKRKKNWLYFGLMEFTWTAVSM